MSTRSLYPSIKLNLLSATKLAFYSPYCTYCCSRQTTRSYDSYLGPAYQPFTNHQSVVIDLSLYFTA
jgi:hypothetical protein